MKFFNRIKSAFYALTHDTTTISLLDERFWTQYGSIRNSKLSEVTYFTCLKTLSEAVAKLPLKMYQETTKGVSKAKNSALYNVLKVRPNKNMTATTFWATVVTVMYHYGNCYVYIARNKEPELLILDNRYMTVYDDNAKLIDDNGGVWYIYSEPVTGKVYKFSTDEILHQNMEQSMEQNGAHNQNSNSTQQMEENVKGADGMENRQGNSFDEMSHQNMEQEEHGTEQVSRMEEQGTTENLTSAGEVTSKEPFSDQEEKPEKNNVNDMHAADQKQTNGFESQQTNRKQPFTYEEPKNMFEKWENKTGSIQSPSHADVNRESTSAMRETKPMREQRKYAENSTKRKERENGKSDFPETEGRKKR